MTIFDIKRFALHDGPGIRTTVFLKGCPLRCAWCHNPESHVTEPEAYMENRLIDGREIKRTRIYGKKVTTSDLFDELIHDRVFFEESGGGVTFSGGEPLLQYEELLELLELLGREKIHRTIDTSGQAPGDVMLNVAGQAELILYDLKLMDPEKHKKYTGVDNRRILENADLLLQHDVEVIFRIPLIPGINDTPEEIDAFRSFFKERSGLFGDVSLLPYHKTGTGKYQRMEKEYAIAALNEPSAQRMQELKYEIESCGVRTTIGG